MRHRGCLEEMRKKARIQLDDGPAIHAIQQNLTGAYKDLLISIISESIKLLGENPPVFAVFCVGSMAREEVCPYSDVEFGFFLKEGTPENLAVFQTEEWLNKNDAEIILVNAMTRPRLLMGDRQLFEKYEADVQQVLDSKIGPPGLLNILGWDYREQLRQKRALELMKGYVTEFEPRLDQDKIALRGFDVKRELYRLPHSVINALALYYGIRQHNTLEQLDALTKMGVFTPEGSSQLKKLLSQAIAWRFEIHLFYHNEKEIFYATKGEEDPSATALFPITKEIREALRESYRTLYPVHEATVKFVEGDKDAFANSSLYNAQLGEIKNYKDDPMRYREAAAAHLQATALDPENPNALANLENIKLTLGEAKQALEHSLERLRILARAHGAEAHPDIAHCKNGIGLALSALGRHEEALAYHGQTLELRKK